jgi:hypothetical protein
MDWYLIFEIAEEFRLAHPDQRENLVVLENLLAEQIPLLGSYAAAFPVFFR